MSGSAASAGVAVGASKAAAAGATTGAATSVVRALVVTALWLCFTVVVLGAYVRLTDAGLGCPDWPGCYGHLTPAGAATDAAIETGKAWREMVHRYAAATLGVLIVSLAGAALVARREAIVPLPQAIGLLLVVIAQGLLGRLTVTWRLDPVVVTSHLVLGCTTLALLTWLWLSLPDRAGSRAAPPPTAAVRTPPQSVRRLALAGLIALAAQIALGGWTSSNYAASACPQFPACGAGGAASLDFRAAFAGGTPAAPARAAIQVTHRLGALLVAMLLTGTAIAALRQPQARARRAAALMLAALGLQLGIGIAMVLRGFPLALATLHNAAAAALLMAAVGLNRMLRSPP